MSAVYTVGTIVPSANANHTLGTIVAWDYDLAMTGKYTMRLNSSTGAQANWGMNLRGIDFGGTSYDPDKVCVVGANTLGQNANLNYSFILCFDRNTSTGVLTTDWNKVIALNLWNNYTTNPGKNPGWEHIQMDGTYIYVATRGSRMIIGANTQSDNQYTKENPMYAAVAKFRISDGAIMWMKKFTFGTSGSFQNAKGITSLALRPDALYASISVPFYDAGYDYLKIDPSNGYSIGVSGLSTSVTMPSSSNVGGYAVVAGTAYDLTTTYTSGSSDVETISTTLDATDLNSTVSNQWHIEPTYVKYPLNSFSSSVNSSSAAVCSATINQTYYFQGTGTDPATNDTVFSNATYQTTVLSPGRYRITSAEFLLVGDNGLVESVNNCSGNTLKPLNVGNPSTSTPCGQFSPGANNYFHNGSGTYPIVGSIIYTTNSTSNPLDGGSGTNWPYFAAGVPPGTSPVGWFRITGSTGTVQSINSCP